jgi:peptidoglycan/LPS O-acetylase OafA/YrhL
MRRSGNTGGVAPLTPGVGETVDQAGEQRSARIESLRALAALAVLFGHVVAASLALNQAVPGAQPSADIVERLLYGGGFGVFFFFALTGYLLFWPFVKRDFGSGEPIDLSRYATNRALRILPLYLVVVVAGLALKAGPTSAEEWIRHLTLTQTFSGETAGTINLVAPLWSIVVEIHFYILLPLLAWAVARIARGSVALAATTLLILAGASLAVRLKTMTFAAGPPDPLWRLNLPTTFLFFVPGMLLALSRLSWERQRPWWLRGPIERADLWIVASLPLWVAVVLINFGFAPLVGVAAFLVVGACVLPLRPGMLTRALEWSPLAILGVASYSLYAWHVPVIEAVLETGWPATPWTVLALASVPASILVALGSYRWIEAPFLRLRTQWSRAAAARRPRGGAPGKVRPSHESG